MALAVVTKASGGLPITWVSAVPYALPVTEATNGIAVTQVTSNGLPVTYITTAGAIVSPFTPTTWNPADINNTTLSLGNLRATVGSGSGGVRGILGKTTGKYYFECTYTTLNSNSFTVGIALSTASVATPGTGAALVLRLTGGISVNAIASGSVVGVIAPGAVVCVAVDLPGQLIWFKNTVAGNWNGSGAANPATGAGGISITSISTGLLYPIFAGQSGDAATANFGASAFAGTVPSGFTAGWG